MTPLLSSVTSVPSHSPLRNSFIPLIISKSRAGIPAVIGSLVSAQDPICIPPANLHIWEMATLWKSAQHRQRIRNASAQHPDDDGSTSVHPLPSSFKFLEIELKLNGLKYANELMTSFLEAVGVASAGLNIAARKTSAASAASVASAVASLPPLAPRRTFRIPELRMNGSLQVLGDVQCQCYNSGRKRWMWKWNQWRK